MRYYLAPLEGITGYIFRNAINEYFGRGIDKYYTPFLVPHVKRAFSTKEHSEISPDNNRGLNLVPQILTNNAEDFVRLAKELHSIGYDEVNLNLGCPSKTVANKGRGAGALRDSNWLDAFLEEIFDGADMNVSVKTRIGIESPDEFEEIMDVYRKYPIFELTIHPRVMKEVYSGTVHRDVFIRELLKSDFPICYNGDINSEEDMDTLLNDIKKSNDGVIPDNLSAVMIGRGILRNPFLIDELTGNSTVDDTERDALIYEFLCKLKSDYSDVFSGQTPLLFKLKEVWSYLSSEYPQKDKLCKKLLKSKSIAEYEVYVKQILSL